MNAVSVRIAFVLAAMVLATPLRAEGAVTPAPTEQEGPSQARGLSLAEKEWKGDFDAMMERRMIRVLAPYSRTLYYSEKGQERGLTAELVRDFERWINKKYAKELGKRPITVYLQASTRDDMIERVAKGFADIAAGNITVTESRLAIADFAAPDDRKPIAEIVMTGPKSPAITTAEDLSGHTVHVRKSSSYDQSLQALNARLVAAGKPPVTLELVPDELEDEDMMEMLNAGLFGAIVVDDWKAKMWAQILPGVKVVETAKLREGAKVGWEVRKESPKLHAELSDFYTTWAKKQGVIEYRQAQMMKRVKQIDNNTREAELKKFHEMVELFRKYGAQYGFDYVMLAAQGYQESRLDQQAKSHVGAIGVMQIMPATGKELKVGDIKVTEHNIHGGAKYMDQLMTRYFKDATFTPGNRPLFAFASYNAGPGNIAKMRKEAEKRGLDPNKWFNNVEIVTADRIGIETTTYVRNIYKYYVAYKMVLEQRERQRAAREKFATLAPSATPDAAPAPPPPN